MGKHEHTGCRQRKPAEKTREKQVKDKQTGRQASSSELTRREEGQASQTGGLGRTGRRRGWGKQRGSGEGSVASEMDRAL
ncbi:hypothetical protein Y1Q_0020794 [Alligator mississippiensis]|uniref:Uncharacterized protein n=1 Tax=Alligator mississippiensis TaxID=8496 RepID=A0A151NJI5_ALLMI|nr:hypothetical protein Y1Q_0020794 [Alligator mississippiensis]